MNAQAKMLFDAVDTFNDLHEQWADNPAQPNPTEEYFTSVEDLEALFQSSNVPPGMKGLHDAVLRLGDEYRNFEARDDAGNAYPHEEFWSARQAIATEREKFKPLTPLPEEPDVAKLVKMGVSKEQITKIWPIAYDDIDKEVEKPGSIIKPGTKSIRDSAREKEHAELMSRLEERQERVAAKAQAKAKAAGAKAAGRKKAALESDTIVVEGSEEGDGPLDEMGDDDADEGDDENESPLTDEEMNLPDDDRVRLMYDRQYTQAAVAKYLDLPIVFVRESLKRTKQAQAV